MRATNVLPNSAGSLRPLPEDSVRAEGWNNLFPALEQLCQD